MKQLTVTSEKEKYGVLMKAEPDVKALGLRLRGESKAVSQGIRVSTHASGHRIIVFTVPFLTQYCDEGVILVRWTVLDNCLVPACLQELKDSAIQAYLKGEMPTVCGHRLEQGDIRVQYSFSGADGELLEQYEAHAEADVSGIVFP